MTNGMCRGVGVRGGINTANYAVASYAVNKGSSLRDFSDIQRVVADSALLHRRLIK